MNSRISLAILLSCACVIVQAQPCIPAGNQTDYGTNNQWIGYVYNSTSFTNYVGYITEGSPARADFDQNFGGGNTTYSTNGCSINTSFFSVRYQLQKTFVTGAYDITVGGDDGYRLSLDGGSTWVIDRWQDQSYTTTTYTNTLSGSYNMVLEFYENTGDNRISIAIQNSCSGTEDVTTYGTADTWIGYVYDGTNFTTYKGAVTEPLNFSQNFGGDNTNFNTSGCAVNTETFSVRYRLRKSFTYGSYTFVVGADDGYRLSLDGGNTWPIDRWFDQGYQSTVYITNLDGNYDMVLEYYENGGGNQVTFNVQTNYILPVTLLHFTGAEQNQQFRFNWAITGNSNPQYFQLQQALQPTAFTTIATIPVSQGITQNGNQYYQYQLPQNTAAYYRLKITDKEGRVSYSSVIQMHPQITGNITVYPTVLRHQSIQIKTQQVYRQVMAQVYNMQGIIVWQQNINDLLPGSQLVLPLQQKNLPAGTYLLRLTSKGEQVHTAKIIIRQR
jgi:hypothetical protein